MFASLSDFCYIIEIEVEKEKDNYLNDRKRYSDESISKANLAKIEYRRKGQYFDEIFTQKR